MVSYDAHDITERAHHYVSELTKPEAPRLASVFNHVGYGSNGSVVAHQIRKSIAHADDHFREQIADLEALSQYVHYLFSELDETIEAEQKNAFASAPFAKRLQGRDKTSLQNFFGKRELVRTLSDFYMVGSGPHEVPLRDECGAAYDCLVEKAKMLADRIGITARPASVAPPSFNDNLQK